jgi:predicted PurR-regulated permease PerM
LKIIGMMSFFHTGYIILMADLQNSYIKLMESSKLKIFFFILLAAVFSAIIYIYSYFFWPFLFAIILYIALKPIYNFILKYIKNRFLCSIIIILSIILFVIVPLFIILFILADQTYALYLYLQQQFDISSITTFLNKSDFAQKISSYMNIGQEKIFQEIVNVLSKTSFDVFSNVTSILSFSFQFILSLFSMLLILFFLFKDGNRISVIFYKNVPFPEGIVRDISGRLAKVIKILFAGNVFIMVLQGILVGICFWIFGIRMPLVWGVVTAVLSLVPAIGTMFVWGPAVIYFVIKGFYISAIILGLWCSVGYLVLENIVKTKLFGKRLNFHPLVFFFLLIGSIKAFNLPGVIIGPVLLSLFVSLWQLYKIIDELGSSCESEHHINNNPK